MTILNQYHKPQNHKNMVFFLYSCCCIGHKHKLHRPTMVSLFEVFYVFFINFRKLNSKIMPRFIHHVQFFNKVLRVKV
jgi:hypothetical protein